MSDNRASQLELKITELRTQLCKADPVLLASRTGSEWSPKPGNESVRSETTPAQGIFTLPLWGKIVNISSPDFMAYDPETGGEFRADVQALLLYYFLLSDGSPLAGEWISFAELPDGRFYNKAFQGYTGNELVRAFRSSYESFVRAAENLGGLRQPFGDVSYSFRALPHVALMAVFWRGDEDFPASIQILFDANASHHLTTDVCAILGSMLTRRLIKAQDSPRDKNKMRS